MLHYIFKCHIEPIEPNIEPQTKTHSRVEIML